jgi:hypothetical protein
MTVTRIPSDVIDVPDFVTMTEPEPGKPIADLAVALVAMFTEDDTLPPPRYLSISQSGQEISMQFGREPDTFHAMARWATRFGGTVTGSRADDIDGKPAVRCEVKFTYAGVNVDAYAYVRTSSTR